MTQEMQRQETAASPTETPGSGNTAGEPTLLTGADKPELSAAERAVPGRPEDYAFEFAPETAVDEKALMGLRAAAHELGLPLGHFQGLLRFYERHTNEFNAARAEEGRALEAEWKETLERENNYPELVSHARKAMERFGSPELAELFNLTRLGSHPALVRFAAKVGKELAEPGAQPWRAPGGAGRSLAEILYPDMN